MLFDYPTKAVFGRILPKSKIYEHAGPSKGVKELFVRQVDQIIWKYKLAPETINLAATKAVSEIQIFHLTLKTGELKDEVLRCIDKAVPFPIIFELHYEDTCKAIACYKRPNEADSTKWVTSDYFGTQWLPQNTPRITLPVVLNLTSLYESLLDPLLPHKALPQEAIAQRIKRMETIRCKEYEISQLELRLQREKQFNRKVEINADIRAIKLEIEGLVTPQLAPNS